LIDAVRLGWVKNSRFAASLIVEQDAMVTAYFSCNNVIHISLSACNQYDTGCRFCQP